VALSAEQKEQIAEIDSKFRALIAEKELFLKDQIAKAQEAGKPEEAESLHKQLAIDIRRLQEDAEAKKEKLRGSFGK
jgi:ABC-type hemin transport system substrate-binding protein